MLTPWSNLGPVSHGKADAELLFFVFFPSLSFFLFEISALSCPFVDVCYNSVKHSDLESTKQEAEISSIETE